MSAGLVYFLCAATSIVCMLLLWQGFRRTRSRLLFWSGLGFVGLAANNAMLVVDMIVWPTLVDLQVVRLAASGMGMATILFGFIWDTEQ